jgi:uridine kinase
MSQDGYEEMSMRAQQTKRPICVLITGRPGSGKSTLADILSKQLYLPKISRDEFKEGYVNTFGVRHDALPPDTNGVVNQVFFQTILNMLDGNGSLLIEAAFLPMPWGPCL